MSNEAISWAFQQTMSPTCKLVLVALANRANDAGECWPSVGTLTDETGLSERAVQNALAALEACGAIDRRERRGTSTVFRCTMKAVEPPQQMHPRTKCTPAADAGRGARAAGEGVQEVRGGGAPAAPKPLLNPKREPTLNPQSARATSGGDFDAFWEAYPRKVSKGAARRAWAAAVGKTTAATILAGLARWRPPSDAKFTPHPATWLSGERWADEEPEPALSVTDQIRRDWNLPEIPDDRRRPSATVHPLRLA